MSTQPTPTFGASGAEDITRIPVTGSSPRENYEVLIGHNLLGKIPEILGNRTKKVLVIHPRALRSTGELVMEDLRAMGYESFSAEIPDAEEAKHYQVAAFCWQVLGQNDFTRTDENLILYTCYPFDALGFTPNRFFVYAKYVSGPVLDANS